MPPAYPTNERNPTMHEHEHAALTLKALSGWLKAAIDNRSAPLTASELRSFADTLASIAVRLAPTIKQPPQPRSAEQIDPRDVEVRLADGRWANGPLRETE